MTGYRLCDNCALKYADCKGNKDKEKCRCDYYKKPVVMNVKELAEHVAELEVMANRYKWVPVTERLPRVIYSGDLSDDVLGTDKGGRIRHVYLTVHKYGKPRFCTVEEGMGVDIIAWMPLPEPYKGGDTE